MVELIISHIYNFYTAKLPRDVVIQGLSEIHDYVSKLLHALDQEA